MLVGIMGNSIFFGRVINVWSRVAETLTIIAREKAKHPSESKLQNAEAEEVKPAEKKTSTLEAKLTEIHSGKEEVRVHEEHKAGKESSPKNKKANTISKFSNALEEPETASKEEEPKFKLDFSIEAIKTKYLYPFNQSKQRSRVYSNLWANKSL